MKTRAQIRSNISVVGRGLNKDENLNYKWGGVPAGAHACYVFETNTIYLPLIDQELLNEDEISVLTAFDRHERKHALWSCGEYIKKEYGKLNALEQELLQRLEDSRIEMSGTAITYSELQSSRIHNQEILINEDGRDQDIIRFRQKENREVAQDHIRYAEMNRWGYLAIALQHKLAGYGNLPINPELQPFFDVAWNILLDGRFKRSLKAGRKGTWIIGDLAKSIYLAWQQEEEKSNDDESNDDSSENEKGKEKKGNKSKGNQKQSKKEQVNNSQENDKNSIAKEFEKSNKEPETCLDYNSLGREIGQISLDQKDKIVNIDSLNIPYNMEDKDIIPKNYPKEFQEIYGKISHKARELRSFLSVILRAQTQTKIQKNRLRGRINKRKLAFVPSGNNRVMQKKTLGKDIETDVQIIIDLSGSMTGEPSELAAMVGITLCEALSAVNGIDVEIIGFNSVPPKNPVQEGMARPFDCVLTHFFKKFDEHYSAVKTRLGSMVKRLSDGGSVGGCNVDHEVIWQGAYRLLQRGKKRKIQFVLSDGMPSGYGGTYEGFLEEELIRVNKKIRKCNIEQVAIGIMTDAVEKFYDNCLVLYELEKLDQEALRLIAKMFLSK